MSTIGTSIRRSMSSALRPFIVKDIKKCSELSEEEIRTRLERFSEATFINFPSEYYNKLFSCWGHCFKSWWYSKVNRNEERCIDNYHNALHHVKSFDDAFQAAMNGASVEEIRNLYNAA